MNNDNKILDLWEEKYHECLALEFSNPNYFEVHHLLVLTFMLQTNGYNYEYCAIAKDLLNNFLNNTLTTAEFSKQFMQFEKRKNINSNDRQTEYFDWNLDIFSLRTDTAEHYCKDVKNWANDVITVINNSKSKQR